MKPVLTVLFVLLLAGLASAQVYYPVDAPPCQPAATVATPPPCQPAVVQSQPTYYVQTAPATVTVAAPVYYVRPRYYRPWVSVATPLAAVEVAPAQTAVAVAPAVLVPRVYRVRPRWVWIP